MLEHRVVSYRKLSPLIVPLPIRQIERGAVAGPVWGTERKAAAGDVGLLPGGQGMKKYGTMTLAATLLLAGGAQGLTAAERCEAAKLKEAGKYGFCRLKAEAKAVKTGDAPDYSKCDTKYGSKWPAVESSGGGMCPSNGDQAVIQSFITQHTDDLATALAGGPLPDCPADLTTCNANLASCAASPHARRLLTGQTTCYDTSGSPIPCAGTGQDGEQQNGLARGYTDNGDGTITDLRTGLMWEKQSDDGSINDWDTTYTWTDALSVFIPALNSGGGFAGHSDWRLPNRNELESLADLGRQNPAIDPIFNTGCSPGCTVTTCSCTSTFLHYWTSTSNYWHTSTAWLVYFVDGDVNAFDKTTTYFARAVRSAD
ncbi:MAG: DUF1566 domain-containing protein [Candidatus Binatia bacterium]